LRTEEQETVRRLFTASTELLHDERVVRSSTAGRHRLFLAVAGALYLTNQRLIFCPYLYTLSWSPIIVEIEAVTSLGAARMPIYRSISHLFVSTEWYVTAGKRTYYFSSMSEDDRDRWLAALSSAAGVPIGERRVF